ncbi:hypothetical protein ACFPJ4_13145 [Lysinimonas soli]|uniref:Uncharacterized protein n=1 Tax=Lysinimonas soli TaxID=1074233 RepID=A0ABW0NTV9_9MICO
MFEPNRRLILECLQELADERFQVEVWAGLDPARMSSFVECCEGLFDDSGLGDALDAGDVFGPELDRALTDLNAQLSTVDEYASIQELLANPRLTAARDMAAAILTRWETDLGG